MAATEGPIRIPIKTRDTASAETVSRVEPAFTVGKVSYYDKLPLPPTEIPRQTLLPMDGPAGIRDWVEDYIAAHPEEKRKIGWDVDESGIRNSQFGSVEHYATVELDEDGNIIRYLFDGILQEDGTLDPRTGIATPGSVVAPIEIVDGVPYVHCFWQWRPAALDQKITIPDNLTEPKDIEAYKAAHRGMWMLTAPGGFAQFVEDSPEIVAKREALEEGGLELVDVVTQAQTFNRASTATLVNVGYATFRRAGEEIHAEGEKLMGSGKMAVRLDTFRSLDAMTMACINFAREELGLVSAGKENKEADQRKLDEVRAQLEEAKRKEAQDAETIQALREQLGLLTAHQNVSQQGLDNESNKEVSVGSARKRFARPDVLTANYWVTQALKRVHLLQKNRGVILPDPILHRLAMLGKRYKTHSQLLPDGSHLEYIPVRGAGVLEMTVAPTVSGEELDALEASSALQTAIKRKLEIVKSDGSFRRVPESLHLQSVTVQPNGNIVFNHELRYKIKAT